MKQKTAKLKTNWGWWWALMGSVVVVGAIGSCEVDRTHTTEVFVNDTLPPVECPPPDTVTDTIYADTLFCVPGERRGNSQNWRCGSDRP